MKVIEKQEMVDFATGIIDESEVIISPLVKVFFKVNFQEIMMKLGPFNYDKYRDSSPKTDTKGYLESRPPFRLPNGAIFIGEWYL